MPNVEKARPLTQAIIAQIVRFLRAGKSIKEIVRLTNETYENIRIIIHRYPEVHRVYAETYHKRHPTKESLPPKLANSLREV